MGEVEYEDELKEKINNFLWTAITPTATIEEAEVIAIQLYETLVMLHQQKLGTV